MIKSLEKMTDEKRRKAVAKKIVYYENKLQEWLKYSRVINNPNAWQKPEIDLIDTLLEKECSTN